MHAKKINKRDPRVAFGKAVRSIRNGKGISQEQLADLAGIHRTYIGDVERGFRNISLVNMGKIAAALGLPLSRLIQEMEKP
jgi:transcriptional regulator with XRE-family HTH domain